MRVSVVIPIFTTISSHVTLNENISHILSIPDAEVILQISSSSVRPSIDKDLLKSPHVLVYTENDGGIYDAMNRGVKRASGTWVLFLGLDDRILIDDFKKMLSELDNSSVNYYSNSIIGGKTYDGIFHFRKLIFKNICHQSILFSRTNLLQSKYDSRFPILADWIYNLNNWRTQEFKYVPFTISEFTLGGVSNHKLDYRFLIMRPIYVLRETRSPWLFTLSTIKSIKDLMDFLFRPG